MDSSTRYLFVYILSVYIRTRSELRAFYSNRIKMNVQQKTYYALVITDKQTNAIVKWGLYRSSQEYDNAAYGVRGIQRTKTTESREEAIAFLSENGVADEQIRERTIKRVKVVKQMVQTQKVKQIAFKDPKETVRRVRNFL